MKQTLPGAWRQFVLDQIAHVRHDLDDLLKRWYELDDVLSHVRQHSAQDGTVRDMLRENVGAQARLAVELRKLRGLLLLTKKCPRCKGRRQKFDRRFKRGTGWNVPKPCSLCRAQGYLWVHP
ncbi:MAG: hypothetical protein QG615_514 [Nitrospirota bacterium]|nr:hypothetical protein [Nitrospirota bacterium]